MPTLRKAKRRESGRAKTDLTAPDRLCKRAVRYIFLRVPMFHPTTIATQLNVWNVLVSRAQRGFHEPLGLLINATLRQILM